MRSMIASAERSIEHDSRKSVEQIQMRKLNIHKLKIFMTTLLHFEESIEEVNELAEKYTQEDGITSEFQEKCKAFTYACQHYRDFKAEILETISQEVNHELITQEMHKLFRFSESETSEYVSLEDERSEIERDLSFSDDSLDENPEALEV